MTLPITSRAQRGPANASQKPIAFDRLLKDQGFGSRSECRQLILAGLCQLAGQPCTDPNHLVSPTPDLLLSVDGETWPWQAKATLMLYKPAGYECSQKPAHYPSVYRLIPAHLARRGVQAVGRLDADTTGLLLMTDDGHLNHRLCSPRNHVAKTYRVVCKHPISNEACAMLLSGVVLHDDPKPVVADAVERVSEVCIDLTLTAGKYHQVKRMLAAAGNRVEQLHRFRVGPVTLPTNLPVGQWRWLSEDECLALEHRP